MPYSPIFWCNGSGNKKKGKRFAPFVKNFKRVNKVNALYSSLASCNASDKLKIFRFLMKSLKFEKNSNVISYDVTKTSSIDTCNESENKDDDSESELDTGSGTDCFDVIALLSNNGNNTSLVLSNGDLVDVDVVRGKYLVICCVSLPVLTGSSVADYCHSMLDSYAELKNSEHDVEIVFVPFMKRGLADDESAFNDFFSGFACLAIPFSQVEARYSICSFIGSQSDITTVVVDPTGLILNHCDAHLLFYKYGSEWFPFHKSTVKDIDNQDEVLRIRLDPFYEKRCKNLPKAVMEDPLLRKPLCLYEDILPSSPIDSLPTVCYLRHILPHIHDMEYLSKRYVGLYLCVDGKFIQTLHEIYQQCIANNQELEIILVCVALFEDPNSYMEKITKALEDCNVSSWFVYVYKSKICRRLMRVFGQNFDSDKFIILPPGCKSGELEGKAVISKFGEKGYPFTRTSILERRLTTLRSITVASWFNGTRQKRTYLYRNAKKHSLRQSEIRGWKLLLYLDWFNFSEDGGELCRLLMNHYRKFLSMGWQVVFVPLDDEDNGLRHADFSEMPWPIMSFSAVVKSSVINQLLFHEEFPYNQVIAVNRNGRVLSRRVGEKLKKTGFNKSLLHDNLREEIVAPLMLIKDE